MTGEAPSRIGPGRALRMFPTFVWRAEIEPGAAARIAEATVGWIGGARRALAPLPPGRAWQSDQTLHRKQEFRELVACIEEATAQALDNLKIQSREFEITGCWANVNAPGAGHRAHSHPNNYLSGVYYVRTWAGADSINFHDPRPQAAILRPPVTGLTADNTDQVVVRVGDGTLLVFPAWLQHSVDANASDRERISISFNIMFPSYSAHMSAPLWQA